LGECRKRGSDPEEPVPQLAVPAVRLDAQLEGDTAKHQPHEHRRDRQVELPKDVPVRQGEGEEEQPDPKHEPGLVGMPERTDGIHHPILVLARRHSHQDAYPEAITVKHHVGEKGHAHKNREYDRQCFHHVIPGSGRTTKPLVTPFPAR